MHAIQTCGNCIRNITTDHFAGVAPDEIVDSFVWCELIRQWSTFHPEFAYLPRKFKIAVNGAEADRAATFVHDIGLHARASDAANGRKSAFASSSAAAWAARRSIGQVIREFLPWRAPADLPRRDPARLQPLRPARQQVQGAHQDPGEGTRPRGFRDEVEAEWAHLQGRPGDADRSGSAPHRGALHAARLRRLPARTPAYSRCSAAKTPFAAWRKRNVHPHKVPGYAAVTLSLKKTGVPPGDVTADADGRASPISPTATASANCASRTSRTWSSPTCARPICTALWREAARARPGHAEHRPAHQHHRLPGRRLLLARQRQVDPGGRGDPAAVRRPRLPARHRRARPQHLRLHELLRPPPRRPHRHPRRRQERARSGTRSRSAATRAAAHRSGKVIGPSFARAEVPDVIERLIEIYLAQRDSEDERFVDVVHRIGIEPFKENVYGKSRSETGRSSRSPRRLTWCSSPPTTRRCWPARSARCA